MCVSVCTMSTVCFTYLVQTLCRKTWKKYPRCTQCHCMSDTPPPPPPPSCPCYHCDRWPCELSLFLTLLSALHIRKRNSSAACKKELCVFGSRGQSFLWLEDSCSVGGRKLPKLPRQNHEKSWYTVKSHLITLLQNYNKIGKHNFHKVQLGIQAEKINT